MSLDIAKVVATLRDLTVKFDTGVIAATPFYPEICTVVNSQGADEKYGFLGNVAAIREWIGDRIFNDLRAAHYTIANRQWEISHKIEKNDIADSRLLMYPPMLQELGTRAALHPDELVLDLLINGGATVCWDGQYFFDTDHAWGDSGSQSNALTYNASDHTAVTGTEFAAAFHAALIKMIGYKDDRGKLFLPPTFNFAGMKLKVLVPPVLYKAAVEGLTADLVGGGNSNVVIGVPEIIPVPYFTSGVKFYVLNTAMPMKPLVFQARQPIQRMMKGMDDHEFKDVKFMADARYNAGYLAWWAAVETTFN